MESLGGVSRTDKSPTRRDQFKSLPQMEDSELLTSEPTPRENYKKSYFFSLTFIELFIITSIDISNFQIS